MEALQLFQETRRLDKKIKADYVGIHVICSAEDYSVVWDGQFSISQYSKIFLYSAGYLPHIDKSSI